MIAPLRLAPLLCLLLAGTLAAQTPGERTARVTERYKSMLLANPVEGLALDRLWKSYDERGESGTLIDEYRRQAESPGAGMAASLIYGHLLQRAGRLDEADVSYERAGTLDPASPLPPLARAELAMAHGEPEKAARLFGLALEKLPAGDRREPEILLKLGTVWINAGQSSKATEIWERIIARAPENLALRRQLAENYEKNGLTERALVHYAYLEAHAEPADRATAARDVARLYEARGEFDAARDALERGLAITARDNWLHGDLETRLIRLYQRAGRLPDLETRWRTAADAAPRDLGGWLRLVALAQAQGDTTGERRWLERLVSLAPGEREYTLRLARRLSDDGDRAQAAALYDGLLKTQPDSVDLIFARAELDLQLGSPAAAVQRIEARIARNTADESVSTRALAFFLDHHLDAAAETRLRAEAARHPEAVEPALALAKFLFTERRAPDARAVLEALARQTGTAAECAERWGRIADLYREQNFVADALLAWQSAKALQPRATAPWVAAGDALLARGDKTAAAEQFEHAAGLVTGPEQTGLEHKLFGVLEGNGDPAATRADEPLGRYLARLEKASAATPTSDNLLRLARWQSWAHQPELAVDTAARAVELDPANLEARRMIATAATELHHPTEAEPQWQELSARDPAHRDEYQRQLAALEMDYGDRDGAVAILTQLQQAAPGSREALTDLAIAQQRVDRWYDALATWEKAYALSGGTPAQRDGIRRPLLAAYERLGQFPRAAEVLRATVDDQTDLAAKTDLFHELAAFCQRHDLGGRLREDYEKRLAARPNDYFLLTALAELRRGDGQERAAYALLQQAYYSSPDAAHSLRELVDQAERLGEDAEAADYQRRLLALPGQSTAANLEKLAALETENLDDPAATRTWESIVGKFPRDPAALGHAADFFQQVDQPERARAMLRQLVEVDDTATGRLLLLATLDARAGDTRAARAHYEQLLSLTAGEPVDEPLIVPSELAAPTDPTSLFGSGRLALGLRGRRSVAASPATAAASEERQRRLQAIEAMSRLLFADDSAPGEVRDAWLQRWRTAADAGAKSEPLAAFFYAGQGELTMGLLARWTQRDDPLGETALGAFLYAGLRLRGYPQLADWAWREADPAVVAGRGRKLLDALQSYLGAGGRPGPEMVASLFPARVGVREILWTAAQNGFAANHWYAQAAELGERVLATAASARASYGLEVAQWEIYAGDPARARDALRRSIDGAEGDSYEPGNGVFFALRAYYLALPEGERAAFVAEYLGRPSARNSTAHAVLAAALLHGLSGDEAAARRDLDGLLAMRRLAVEPATLSPDVRRWGYLLANGEQLQAWGLDSLAIHLWRRALAEAGGFDRQNAEVESTVMEIRRRLLGLEVANAPDPFEGGQRLAEYLAEFPEPSAISGAAGQLWSDGQREAAARIYEILFQTNPANGEYWPNLYSFYESTGNDDAAELMLGRMLAGTRPLPAGASRAELTCSLAALRDKRGDGPGAGRLLERARIALPGNLPILIQLAQWDEGAGRWEDAASVWREACPLDQTHGSRLGLARVLEHLGRRGEAIALLRDELTDRADPGRVELAVRLTQLLLADGRPVEVRAFASELLKKGQGEPLPAMGAALAAGNQAAMAREILSSAVLGTRDPLVRFHLQQALVEQMAVPDQDPAAFVRQMRRLGAMAQTSEAWRGQYEELLYPLAHRANADAWLEGELLRGWDAGKGDPVAGMRLAGLALQNHREDTLRAVVQAIDHRPDLPEKLLWSLATSLIETDHASLALELCARLAKRFPQKQEYALARALALWKTDRRPEAEQVLGGVAASAIFNDGALASVATFYLQRDEKARAADYLRQIIGRDPAAVRFPQAFLQFAQIALDEKRLPEAGRLLRIAYARPACDDLALLVRYVNAAHQTDPAGMPAPDFPLTFARRARLLGAVSHEEDGRLLATHAEFLAATPELAAGLARSVTPANVRSITACLERATDQSSRPSPRLSHELAVVYAQWAVWDANAPATRNDALAHLSRACELEPDNFAVASGLAKLCLEQNQGERAREVLTPFLSADALPSEREDAQRILNR